MGDKAREVIKMDVDELIELLNKALADEWMAVYQYWIGAKVVTGPMRGLAAHELNEHATEELKHADMLAERIIQLGGTPLVNPQQWFEQGNCEYKTPKNMNVRDIVYQNLEGERCAIDVYQHILETIHDKDPITYNIVVDILDDELEHEEDLQSIIEDIDVMKQKVR